MRFAQCSVNRFTPLTLSLKRLLYRFAKKEPRGMKKRKEKCSSAEW